MIVEYKDMMGWFVLFLLGGVLGGGMVLIFTLFSQTVWIKVAATAWAVLGIIGCIWAMVQVMDNEDNVRAGAIQQGVQLVGGEGKNASFLNGIKDGEPVQCFKQYVDEEHVRVICG